MRIGEIIKTKRSELELTQEELANKLHVTRQAISNWENNKSVPDIEFVRQLASEFEMSIDEMLVNEVKKKVYKVDKRSKNNSIAIIGIILSILIMVVFIVKLLPFYLAFSSENKYIGKCSQTQLNDIEVIQDGNYYTINTFEELTYENIYCVPITYSFQHERERLESGGFIENWWFSMQSVRGFDVFHSDATYNIVEEAILLEVNAIIDKSDDLWEFEKDLLIQPE